MGLRAGLRNEAQAKIVTLKDTARAGLKIERRHTRRISSETQGSAQMKRIAHKLPPDTGITIRVLHELDESLRLENGRDSHNKILDDEANDRTARR